MSLLEDLERIRDHFLTEVRMVCNFIEKTERSLTRKQKAIKPSNWSLQDIADLEKLMKFIEAYSDPRIKKPPLFTLKSKRVRELLRSWTVPARYKEFLAEMTLSYLVSYQEAFIKEYLRTVLTSRKSILKSKKQLSYREVCAFRSIKSLISYVAQKEVDVLGYGSVDDLADYFKDRFNLVFEDFTNWPALREASYRRNLILHNGGVTNDTYCTKTGYKKKNQHLRTDVDYVKNVSEPMLEFIPFLHDQMTRKLKLVSTTPKT